ncbi:uncharacterized protein SPSK_09864 [Sporothrix schenckii 1099-18]|uniref:Uncharacterized protein n=1 Tax=Sporothrix schenckii 1099-18 TaxID=1397361 RepID=A0A0F2M8X2_SPOSC|nr:uncharacterized protein SPSK_09864 [Sporothrix schenckii 1099-18]KJR84611.1 hypothetical protein SPSK_09864 [Sporothrix schenckii 1099-18]
MYSADASRDQGGLKAGTSQGFANVAATRKERSGRAAARDGKLVAWRASLLLAFSRVFWPLLLHPPFSSVVRTPLHFDSSFFVTRVVRPVLTQRRPRSRLALFLSLRRHPHHFALTSNSRDSRRRFDARHDLSPRQSSAPNAIPTSMT